MAIPIISRRPKPTEKPTTKPTLFSSSSIMTENDMPLAPSNNALTGGFCFSLNTYIFGWTTHTEQMKVKGYGVRQQEVANKLVTNIWGLLLL